MNDLRQVLEQTIASAQYEFDYPALLGTQPRVQAVTIIPTKQWSQLVFAIHDHLKEEDHEGSEAAG